MVYTDFPHNPSDGDLLFYQKTQKVYEFDYNNNRWNFISTIGDYLSNNPKVADNVFQFGNSTSDIKEGQSAISYSDNGEFGHGTNLDVSIGSPSGDVNLVAVEFTGEEFGIFWYSSTDKLRFIRANYKGELIENSEKEVYNITDPVSIIEVKYKDGMYILIAYRTIYILDRYANIISSGSILSGNGFTSLDFYNSKAYCTYIHSNNIYCFIGESGSGNMYELNTENSTISEPAIAVNNNIISLVFIDTDTYSNGGVRLRLYDLDCNAIIDEVEITSHNNGCANPKICAGNDYIGIIWEDETSGDTDVYFQRIDYEGNLISSSIKLNTQTDVSSISIIFDEIHFIIGYHAQDASGQDYGYIVKIDEDGNIILSERAIAFDTSITNGNFAICGNRTLIAGVLENTFSVHYKIEPGSVIKYDGTNWRTVGFVKNHDLIKTSNIANTLSNNSVFAYVGGDYDDNSSWVKING